MANPLRAIFQRRVDGGGAGDKAHQSGEGRRRPRLHAWQIEITSRCSLRCVMCPKTAGGTKKPAEMSLGEFGRILPCLPGAEHVVLEGWGESTLHPHLIEIVKLVHSRQAYGQDARAGAVRERCTKAGFVTGGAGLNEEIIDGLIEAGLDFIGFSLAGATPRTHEAIRKGSDLRRLLGLIKYLLDLKGGGRDRPPKVHIVFVLLKSNIEELPLLVRLAAEIGVPEVNLINAVHLSNRAQDEQRVFAYEGGEAPYGPVLAEAERLARRLGVRLRIPGLVAREAAVCEENPLGNLYVSAEGEISPCVFLAPPVGGGAPFRRFFRGDAHFIEKVSFGNVFREPFKDIWENGAYEAFRRSFQRRLEAVEEAREAIFTLRQPKHSSLPEAPLPCRTCHKLYGL